MKVIEVDFNYECPFHYEEEFRYSEYTAGTESKCTILSKDCCGFRSGKCPLKNESITVKVKGE